MKCYLVFVGSVLIFFDNSLTQSFVNKGSEHQCVIGRRGANYVTELLQQKKQAPVGGDFIELGSSLITLLNLAQEIGSSNNLRFRQAADKLRNQFARSFALRYDLEKSQFLSTALSSIDGDSHLTEAQRDLQALVLSQLKGIERKASSIIFFNEPLPNLEEFHYPFSFPYDALKPFDGQRISDLSSAAESDKEISQEKRAEQRKAQYVQSLLSRVKGTDQIGSSFLTGAEDMRKLKLGLQVETRKWRAEAAKLMRIQSKKQSSGGISKAWGRAVSTGDSPGPGPGSVQALATTLLSEAFGDSKSRYRPLTVEAVRPGGVGVEEERREASMPVSVLQEQRQLIRANGGRWRASLELINSAKDRGRARDRDEGIEIPSPYEKVRELIFDDRDREAIKDAVTSTSNLNGGSPDNAPNYALLIHSCLLLSQSTYNLKLSGEWIDMDFHFDSEKTIEQISEAISKAADAFNLSISMNKNNPRKSPLTPPSSSSSSSSSSSPFPTSSLPSATLDAADIARTQALVFKAFGGSSFPRDSLSIQTIHSDKACAVIMHDERRDVIVIAFRGTKDPVDLITDITFFSTAFAPRKLDESASTKRNSFSANAAVLISRDPPPSSFSNPGSGTSPPPPLAAAAAASSNGEAVPGLQDPYSFNMEVHTGFLGAFESIKDKIDLAMSEMKTTGPGTASTGPSVLLTGHSMGGALAQIAAAYYADLSPTLVTFATPSIGNPDFCSFLTEKVQPAGGLRVWNEYDAIPYIALLVGYQHVGIPIKTRLKKSAKELFQNESVNAITAGLDVVSPHVLFQIGSLVHVFPIIGNEVGAKEKVRDTVNESEKEIEKGKEKEESDTLANRLLANDQLYPLTQPIRYASPAALEVEVEAVSGDLYAMKPSRRSIDMIGEERIVGLSGIMDSIARSQTETVPTPIITAADSIITSPSATASTSALLPPPYPLQYSAESKQGTATVQLDKSARAGTNALTPFGLDAESDLVSRSILEEIDASMTLTGVSDSSPSFYSSDLQLTSSTSNGGLVEEKEEEEEGEEEEEVEGVDALKRVEMEGQVEVSSARRNYSYSDEELDEEDDIDFIALAPSIPLDKKKAGQASRDFPYHPAFQPVFSVVEKDKSEDFTPDSYYDQFKNEKQFFLQAQGLTTPTPQQIQTSNIDAADDADGYYRSSNSNSNKGVESTAPEDVRRLMRELREEAVFRDIDMSHRRGIMERIWEEIKDAEAVTVSSLSDWMEDKEDEEDEDEEEDGNETDDEEDIQAD